jgi:hypothetical protein
MKNEKKPGQTKKLEKYRKLPKDLIIYVREDCKTCEIIKKKILEDNWVLGRLIVIKDEDLSIEDRRKLIQKVPKKIKSFPLIEYDNVIYSHFQIEEVLTLVGKDCYSNIMFDKCYSDAIKEKVCLSCNRESSDESWLKCGICSHCVQLMIRKRLKELNIESGVNLSDDDNSHEA